MSSLEIVANDDDVHEELQQCENHNDDRKLLSVDEHDSDHEQSKLRHWKESDYAAGLVEPTWVDEWEVYRKKHCCDWGCGCVTYPSAVVCTWLGAGRVGNMAVLKERDVMVEADDDDDEDTVVDDKEEGQLSRQSNNTTDAKTTPDANPKQFVRKREIQLVVGPYWPLLIFITYPLIFGMSAFTLYRGIPGKPLVIQIVWALLTLQLIRSLFNTGFRDPGILSRRMKPLSVKEKSTGLRLVRNSRSWKWDYRVQSYRPKNSTYCHDCKVVVEEFDHT